MQRLQSEEHPLPVFGEEEIGAPETALDAVNQTVDAPLELVDSLAPRYSLLRGLSVDKVRELNQQEQAEIEALTQIARLDPNGAVEMGTITPDQITAMTESLCESNGAILYRDIIARLVQYVQINGQEGINTIEKALEQVLPGKQLTLSVLHLLGEINPYRQLFISDGLAKLCEREMSLNNSLVAQLRVLNRANDPQKNRLARKIWDFAREYIITIQDHIGRELKAEMMEGYIWGLCTDFFSLTEQELPFAQNYLVKKELQEIRDAHYPDNGSKEGALPGVGGGATDKTIFTFKHRLDSYQNRLALGINEGSPIAQPVIAIAPGFYAYYQSGKVSKVFSDHDYDLEGASKRQASFLANNSPEDEQYGVYNEINQPMALRGQFAHPSNKLQRLRPIWDFNSHLKERGRGFFYDVDKIDHDELHPMVDAEILVRNFEYIHTLEGKENRAKPLSQEELEQLLVPGGQLDQAELESYLNLTSLQMRKKVEEDFQIKLSDCSFWVQRLFLKYLEVQDITSVELLQKFVQRFGAPGLSLFLSLEEGVGREEGVSPEQFMRLLEALPEADAVQIIQKFNELANAAEGVRAFLRENFGAELEVRPELIRAVAGNLLDRGRQLLQEVQVSELSINLLTQRFDQNKADLLLLRGVLVEARRLNMPLSLEECLTVRIETVSGVDLIEQIPDQKDQGSTRETLRKMLQANWSKQGEEGEKVIKGFDDLLKDPEKMAKTNFYVVRHQGNIPAFFRMYEQEDGSYYLGSVNADPEVSGAKVGEGLLDAALVKLSAGKLVRAECNPQSPISGKYIGKYGFVARRLSKYVADGDTFEIERDDREGVGLDLSKSMFAHLNYIQLQERLTLQGGQVKSRKFQNAELWSYTFKQDRLAFVEEVGHLLEADPDTCITAYQTGPKDEKTGEYPAILGIERISSLRKKDVSKDVQERTTLSWASLGSQPDSKPAQTVDAASGRSGDLQ